MGKPLPRESIATTVSEFEELLLGKKPEESLRWSWLGMISYQTVTNTAAGLYNTSTKDFKSYKMTAVLRTMTPQE